MLLKNGVDFDVPGNRRGFGRPRGDCDFRRDIKRHIHRTIAEGDSKGDFEYGNCARAKKDAYGRYFVTDGGYDFNSRRGENGQSANGRPVSSRNGGLVSRDRWRNATGHQSQAGSQESRMLFQSGVSPRQLRLGG